MLGKRSSRGGLMVLSAVLLNAGQPLIAQVAAPSAASHPATEALLDKARTLEARGRMDMAAQTWQQVLLADPNNTAALGGLARAAKMSGNQALSNTYLQRLRAINPNDPGIARAESVMAQGAQLSQLQQAGKCSAAGNYAQAMTIYRQVFGSTPPQGDWALAYYETESATEDGRPHAIAGLRALMERYPQDSRYQVALGRILTYTAKTRAEGRHLLDRHPNDPQANEALKQALVWDAQNPATSGEIRTYLQKHRDPQLQEALATTDAQQRAAARRRSSAAAADLSPDVQEQRARGAEEAAAYAALNRKDYTDSESRFRALLATNPNNPRALAGMGYVRMNQQNFGGAISFFEQAKQDGAADKGLDMNLATARYFYMIQEGGTALTENDLTTAEKQYREALALRPAGTEAMQGLGGTMMKAQQPAVAAEFFAAFLKLKPASPDGWKGLFMAEYQAGNAARALETERRLPPAVRNQLMRDPEFVRTLASSYSAVGRDADAQRVLRSALDLPFPTGALGLKAETQLQYAGLLLQANHLDQAGALYRQVLADDPTNVSAWQGLIGAQHNMHKDALAIQTLESMPPAVYDQSLRDSGFLGTAASIYQSQNKFDIAQSLLERAIAQQQTTGQKVPVPLQVELAGLYLQRNDPAHAFPIYQRVLSESPDRVDAWKGLLSSLHSAGRDGEALAQIQQIPPASRKTLESDVEYLQTVGNIYNGLGQPQNAMLFLRRVQLRYAQQHATPPPDVDIQNAWLLFNGANDTGLYRQLLVLGTRNDLSDDQRRTVQTIWASWAVRRANAAGARGDVKRSLLILNAAAKAFPDNPGVLRALAGGYQRAGMPKQAVMIYKAQDMTAASASDYKGAVGAALSANDTKSAETWLRYGLNQYPRDGQMLGLAAKFEQARGDNGRASDYYKASLAALPPPDPGSELAYMLNQPTPLNPRALPTSTQAPDLAGLLAPGSEDRNLDASPVAGSQEPVQPYLPSLSNGNGTAPVQLGNRAPLTDQNGYAVPSYMANPQSSVRTQQSPQRLRDYRPSAAPSGSAGMYPGINVSETYTMPEVNPSAPAPVSLARTEAGPATGLSAESDLPAPGQDTAATNAGLLTYQQQQILRLTQQAQSADGSAYQPYRRGGRSIEGAQTAEFNGEVYGPYVPYLAPQSQSDTPLLSYAPRHVAVPGSRSAAENRMRNAKSARTGTRSGSLHPEIEAAEAAATRRRQSDPRSMMGQSNPPADGLGEATAKNAQYGDTQYGGGQGTQSSGLPPTAPTGQTYSSQTSQTSQNSQNSPMQAYGQARTLSGGDESYGQQYPQPPRRPVVTSSTARRRVVKQRPAAPVGGLGVASAPVFYPSAPTSLSSQPYPDLPPYNGAGVPPSDAMLTARNVPPLRGGYTREGTPEVGPPLNERQQTELDLAQLEASYSAWMGGSGYVRFRSGRSGVDRYFDYEVPYEASVVVGKSVRFTVVPRGVFLNNGTLDLSNVDPTSTAVPVLGTLPITAINSPAPQYSSGVGGELQMVTTNLALSVGYTPYQFLVSNITARGRFRLFNHLTIFGERDSVKDTELSYAGLRDPGSVTTLYSGNIWGGVISTGGGLRFDFGDERSGFYASADGAAITGYHVLENRKYEGTMGAYFRVAQFPGVGSLNVGANFFGMHYDHNERPLTYGLGGYFSPNVYFLGSIPVSFQGSSGNRWHYVVSAAAGLQTFEEENQQLFPLDAAQQNGAYAGCSLVQIAQHTCATAEVLKSTSTGGNFNIGGEFSYRFNDHWFIGSAITANNTNNYTMVQPTFFARYLFRPQMPTDDYPTGLFPMEGFRPLRVP